jgi:hypothetical protein
MCVTAHCMYCAGGSITAAGGSTGPGTSPYSPNPAVHHSGESTAGRHSSITFAGDGATDGQHPQAPPAATSTAVQADQGDVSLGKGKGRSGSGRPQRKAGKTKGGPAPVAEGQEDGQGVPLQWGRGGVCTAIPHDIYEAHASQQDRAPSAEQNQAEQLMGPGWNLVEGRSSRHSVLQAGGAPCTSAVQGGGSSPTSSSTAGAGGSGVPFLKRGLGSRARVQPLLYPCVLPGVDGGPGSTTPGNIGGTEQGVLQVLEEVEAEEDSFSYGQTFAAAESHLGYTSSEAQAVAEARASSDPQMQLQPGGASGGRGGGLHSPSPTGLSHAVTNMLSVYWATPIA